MRILKYLTLCLLFSFWAFAISGTIQAHTSQHTVPHDDPMHFDEIVELKTPEAKIPELPVVRLVSFEDPFAVDPIIKNLTEEEKIELQLIADAEDLIDGVEGELWVMLTVINRIRENGGTVHSTIYAPNQYYTAGIASTPSEVSYQALEMLMCGIDPSDGARYFRTGTYHSFGTPVAHVGHHYYSK